MTARARLFSKLEAGIVVSFIGLFPLKARANSMTQMVRGASCGAWVWAVAEKCDGADVMAVVPEIYARNLHATINSAAEIRKPRG